MRLWMKKLAVVLITILTLGMYIPPIAIHPDTEENKDTANLRDDFYFNTPEVKEIKVDEYIHEQDPIEQVVMQLTEKAKAQTITKLGPRIMNQIKNDVFETILPHMETVIEKTIRQSEDDHVPFYEITEDPAKGLGERIFNVYDHKSESIILKFHVRRDNRPLEGYWFNFHYHASADNFEKHYDIGDIYWDKNMPPRWMA